MTQEEKFQVLDGLSRNDILLAMEHLDTLKEFKVGNNFYYEVKNPNSEMCYPVEELIEAALELKKVDFKNDLFDKPRTSDPVYIILVRLGFNYSPKKKESILLKLSKTQDLRNEIYIPKKYIGKENKFFPDPRLKDPTPQGETPHITKILIKWKGIDSDFREYDLKNFRNEFDANADTRIAGTPSKSLNSIIIFRKIENNKYEVELIEKESSDYTRILNKMDNKSYMLLDEMEMSTTSEIQKTKPCFPLNQILYGPPGTGKTYHTVIKSMVILGELEEKKSYSEAEYKNALDIFQQEIGNRIEFVSMHQSFSYEDFVQGLRPKTINGSIQFEYTDGVFKNICTRASEALTGDRSEVSDIQISNNEIAEIAFFLSKFNGKKKDEKVGVKSLGYQSDDEAFRRIGEKIGVKPNTLKNHRDRFDFKFSDRIGYTSRKGWVPRNGTVDLDNTFLWPYQEIYNNLNDLSLDQLKARVLAILNKVDSATTRNPNGGNFVIILDEINRANISKVFGELITLIEDDKRETFTVRLPSGDFFSVPTNLYIIGTMNTADKSVSMVDIALRRRFEFEAIYPNIELVKDVEKKQFMIDLNREIIDKKGIDFQIGHSDFMKDTELFNIINRKVIPLLMEYFRNRHDDVSEILNNCLPSNLELDKELLKSKLVQVILKNN